MSAMVGLFFFFFYYCYCWFTLDLTFITRTASVSQSSVPVYPITIKAQWLFSMVITRDYKHTPYNKQYFVVVN